MNLTDELVTRKIADNTIHAEGMLRVLEFDGTETDAQKIARCELYNSWKHYYKKTNPKEFRNDRLRKAQARKNAIAGLAVPELPILAAVAVPAEVTG